MLLPNREKAYVEIEKLLDYLLSETHPVGKSKARFFLRHGFTKFNHGLLERQFIKIAQNETVVDTIKSEYGTKYAIDGFIEHKDIEKAQVRTFWIIEKGKTNPRLITAYPIKNTNND